MQKKHLKWLSCGAFLLILSLSGCDRNTFNGVMDKGKVRIADRNLPADGEGTSELADHPSGHYSLINVEVRVFGAEYDSSALLTHRLHSPEKLSRDRDSFSGVSSWVPEDDQRILNVKVCLPLMLELGEKGQLSAQKCVFYNPSSRDGEWKLDFFDNEGGLKLFETFRSGVKKGHIYTLPNDTVVNATVLSNSNGVLKTLFQVDFPEPRGKKSFHGAARKYYIELSYARTKPL